MSSSIDSLKGIESKGTPVIQKIVSRTVPGILTNHNKGAIDWGWQSFIAYGCNSHVVIVDTQNVKVFQTLDVRKGDIVKVKWARDTNYHDLDNPYSLLLASADTTGSIVIWDVKEGKVLSTFSDSTKPVAEIQWFTGRDACQHLLVALHPPYSLIVWDTQKGSKIWKKSYTEPLQSFSFDPFSESNIAFLAQNCILFVDDFNIVKTPSSNGRKFYVTNPSSSNTQPTSPFSNGASSNEDRSRTAQRSIIPKRMRFLVKADSKINEESVTLNECIQLSYHHSYRHHLLLLYPKEVLILDLEINQTVGIVSLEHCSIPMSQLYSCWQRDVFYILCENGNIGFYLRHSGHTIMAAATPLNSEIFFNSNDANLEVTYDLNCISDALRLTKHAKVVGMSVCPVSEKKIALLVSDGRMFFLELGIIQKKCYYDCWTPHLAEVLLPLQASLCDSESMSEKPCLPYYCEAEHPANVLSDDIGPSLYPDERFSQNIKESLKFRLYITGNLCALAAPPHVIKMCPPVTFRNWTAYRPLMAVGNISGSIQIFDMATGLMEKEYSVHTCPVRGIEWIGLTSFMSFGHPNVTSSLGRVRNELVMCDVQSGRMKSLRNDRNEESPIEMLRVSCLRQYVIIVFKDEPFELWDLRLLTLLRVMPKNFPTVTALEWSPAHSRKQQSVQDIILNKVDENNISTTSIMYNETPKSLTYGKEHFVFTDTNGQLYHFSVEGNAVKDVSTIPADAGMGSVTCIAWKSDYIVLGDVDGNLNILNLKDKVSKGLPTHRGWIKKVRFGPGKGNMKVLILYNDGVDLRDVKEMQTIYQIRCPREMPKVQDIDWVCSDRPCLATSDGCLRIMDVQTKSCFAPVNDYQPSDIPFSPHVLSAKVAFYLKSYLHHSLWKQKFNIDIDQQDDLDMLLAENQLKTLDDEMKSFLENCPFGVAERCLHVSRIFGDEEGCHFWTVALHVLKEEKHKNNKEKAIHDSESLENIASADDPDNSCNTVNDLDCFFDQPLDTGYDSLCDNDTYKKLQLDRVLLHVYKRTTHTQTQQCAERLLLLGQTEKAVQLLLETETGNENFYVDCLRACLIATVQYSGTSQSIIKLVSTNLIANGYILEGVQLLCLINKALDACRYLQGAGRWDEAVWLAKATLSTSECHDILKRWVDHLYSQTVGQKNKALLVLLTMHQFWKVVLLMHESKMIERAALFLQACIEFGVITRNEDNSDKIDAVYLEYSKYLLSIKNRTSAIHYCKLVSDIGDDLRKQIEFMNEEYEQS